MTAKHEIWMDKALELASKALAQGEFPVGCVLVAQEQIVGVGLRAHTSGSEPNELDHAEILALRNWLSNKSTLSGGVTAYCTLEPCLMCFGALLINGVKRIVFAYEDVMGGATGLDLASPTTRLVQCSDLHLEIQRDFLYRKDGIEVIPGIRRAESLALFKRFFSDPASRYLSDTLLAKYTLNAL